MKKLTEMVDAGMMAKPKFLSKKGKSIKKKRKVMLPKLMRPMKDEIPGY